MRTQFLSARIISCCALSLWLGACTSSPGTTTGAAGAGAQGTAGAGTQGTAGAGTQGTAGAGTQGTAGAGTQGTAGVTGTAGATAGATGTAGATAGATGTAGATAGATGTAGATAGATGTAGAAAGATGTGGTGAPVMSAGCSMAPAAADSMTTFKQKVLMVAGVDPAFVTAHPVNNGDQFNWTKRNYYVRLPAGYNPDKAYPVDLEGTGCAGGETTGSSGEYTLPAMTGQTEAIQIGLSYVTSTSANPSCVAFTDDYTNSPEPMYISGVIDDVASKYCIDKNRVFINGYSSGAFESSMAGGANADKIRAIGLQIGGGYRMKHPPYMNKPVAAMFVVGTLDQGNPIGPLATAMNDTIGSVAARDELLHRNGCVAADFQIVDTCAAGAMLPCTAGVVNGDTYGNAPNAMWDAAYPKCHTYTGCPPKYPVVWCPIDVNHGNGPNPMGADAGMVENYRRTGMWKFFSTLPAL